MNSNDEFLKAFISMELIPAPEIEYRIHYNSDGEIYLCTQTDHPDNSQYLVVDKQTYDNFFRYYVVNGKLKLIDRPSGDRVQLKRSNQGYAVVKNHAGLLLENENYSNVEYYSDVD